MNKLSFLGIITLLAFIYIISLSFATNSSITNNTIASTNTISITSVLTNNTISNAGTSASNSINTGIAINTFKNIVNPYITYIEFIVLIIFVIILLYGITVIYSSEFDTDVTNERKMKMLIEYALGSVMVLLLIPYIYIYFTYFPQIIQATAPALIASKSIIPIYIIWFDIFISVLVSLVGFLLAIKEYIAYIKTYQTGGTGKNTTEAERSQILQRVFAITLFMFLSPFVLGIIFVVLTGMFFSVSTTISSSLASSLATASSFKFPFYQTNLYPQCSGPFGVFSSTSCFMYGLFDSVYGVGFEATVFNGISSIMLSSWGSLPLFMILYDIIILILMIYSFGKIDWYSLQYLSSLKTGELEARNYNKLKNSYVQYIAFLLSPIIFIISILVLNAFVSVMLSIISTSQLSVVPPLINLAGTPTVENILLSVSGMLMSFYAVFLLLVVLIAALLKILGGILFAIGIFFYFSDDIKYKMFGKNLITFFIILYMIPVIILLLYSVFFGLLPSLISQGIGYGNATAVSSSQGGFFGIGASYYSKSTSSTGVIIYGQGLNGGLSVSCINSTNLYSSTATLGSLSDSRDALGVLLGSCENFVGFWSSGYDIIAILTLVIMILLVLGIQTIATAFAGVTGIGGAADSVSLTKGIQGKPLKDKISQIAENMGKNRSNFFEKMGKKALNNNQSLLGYVSSSVAKKGIGGLTKIGSSTLAGMNKGENIVYPLVTAPISGTLLGSSLDTFRSGTKKLVSNMVNKTKSDFEKGQKVYVSNKEIDNYAVQHKEKDETDEQAKTRFRKTLEDEYDGNFDKNGNLIITKGNLEKLEKTTNHKFSSEVKHFRNSNIEKLENERDAEIKRTNDHYEALIEKSEYDEDEEKTRQLREEQKKAIEEINNKYKPKLDDISKKENFKDYESYRKIISVSEDVDAIIDPNSYIEKKVKDSKEKVKSEILEDAKRRDIKLSEEDLNREIAKNFDELSVRKTAKKEVEDKKKNFVNILSEYGLPIDSLTNKSKAIENILKNNPNDLRNITYFAFDNMTDTKEHDKIFSLMVEALTDKEPNIRYKSKVVLGNFGKEVKSEYFNPMVSAVNERYKDTKEVIGDLKNYAFVDGIPVYSQYNNKLSDYNKKIDEILNESSEYKDILTNPKSSISEKVDAEIKLKELYDKFVSLELERKKLERKKDFIDNISPVFKGLLKGENMPSFSSLVKTASSDESTREIGIIEMKKKMLENETRIINKNIEGYKNDLMVANENLKKKDLTEYQKLQYEKVINDLNYKIKNLEGNKKLFTNRIEDMSHAISVENKIKNAQKLADDIYNNAIIEGNIYKKFEEQIHKDPVLSELYEQKRTLDTIENKSKTPSIINDNISSVVDKINDYISNKQFDKLNFETIKINEDDENLLQSLNNQKLNEYKNKIISSINTLSYIKDNKINDAETSIKSIFNDNKIKSIVKDSFINNLSNSIDKINKDSNNEQKSKYERLFENIKNEIMNNKNITTTDEMKEFVNKSIEKSDLSGELRKDSDVYKQIIDLSKFNDVYKENMIETLNKYIQQNKEEMTNELTFTTKAINEELNKTRNSVKDFMKKFGTDDIDLVGIGRYLTTNDFKNVINETERNRFDYEIFKNRIKKYLTSVANKYSLSKDDIENISSFDVEVLSKDNPDLNEKYLNVLKDIILPELNNIKHNNVANIINKSINYIQNGRYVERDKELNSLAITTLTSDLARSYSKLESMITNKKNAQEGMRSAKFGYNRFVRNNIGENRERHIENEDRHMLNIKDDEDKTITDDKDSNNDSQNNNKSSEADDYLE